MLSQVSLLQVIWEQSKAYMLLLLILVLACVGFYLADKSYFQPKLENLRQQEVLLEKQIKQQQEEIVKRGAPISEAERLGKYLSKFSETVPAKANFSNFVGDLFSMANDAELVIREISYSPEVDEETGFLNYGLNFSVAGTYRQIKKFIHLLENSQRLLVIERITLGGRKDKTAQQAVVALQIDMTTYFQEQQ